MKQTAAYTVLEVDQGAPLQMGRLTHPVTHQNNNTQHLIRLQKAETWHAE